MKRALRSIARGMTAGARTLGIDVRSLRDFNQSRRGIEIIWQPADLEVERCYICRVSSFGDPVSFLVRDERDYIQSHHFNGMFYAEPELRLIQEHYRGGTFLDVGANVGNHSLFAAMILKAPRVISVEPFPDAYAILKCNIALNHMTGLIEHYPVALSDGRGSGAISAMEGNLGFAVLTMGDGEIQCAPGDSLFEKEDIGFLKMDVEGMEMKALRGLERTLERCRPAAMIEVDDRNRSEFELFLERMGYEVAREMRTYPTNAYILAIPR